MSDDVQVRSVRRRRPKPENARVAKRVKDFCECAPAALPEGVQPLNAGFFSLEAMREHNVKSRKARAKKRRKVRGK